MIFPTSKESDLQSKISILALFGLVPSALSESVFAPRLKLTFRPQGGNPLVSNRESLLLHLQESFCKGSTNWILCRELLVPKS